jgi:hypothetical protein
MENCQPIKRFKDKKKKKEEDAQGEEDFLSSILVPFCTTPPLVLRYLQRASKVTFVN